MIIQIGKHGYYVRRIPTASKKLGWKDKVKNMVYRLGWRKWQ